MELSDEALSQMLLETGQNIRVERKKHGISISRLADMANLSVSHISKLENEQCEIGLKALIKISAAFGKDVEDLLPPFDRYGKAGKQKIQTVAERFETVTQDADIQTVEFILKMTAYMVHALHENVSYKKQKKQKRFPQADEKQNLMEYNVFCKE